MTVNMNTGVLPFLNDILQHCVAYTVIQLRYSSQIRAFNVARLFKVGESSRREKTRKHHP